MKTVPEIGELRDPPLASFSRIRVNGRKRDELAYAWVYFDPQQNVCARKRLRVDETLALDIYLIVELGILAFLETRILAFQRPIFIRL